MKKRQPKKQYKLVDGHRVRICDYMNCRQNAPHTIKIKKGVKLFRCNNHNMVMASHVFPLLEGRQDEVWENPEKKTWWEKIKRFVVEEK